MERTLVNALHSTANSIESEMKRGAAKLRYAGGGGGAQRHVIHGNEPSKTCARSARAPSVVKNHQS
jgi:hypothetical protein